MARDYSFSITKTQYNYLLPIYGIIGQNRLLQKSNGFYFICSYDEYLDLLNRCKYL